MSNKEKPLQPIQGIIKDEPESVSDIIEQVLVIIRLEGEAQPICLNVEDSTTKEWIVEALLDNFEEDIS